MYKQLVVSHYEQNLSWVSTTTAFINTIVYDKSKKDTGLVKLENLGREPHTYVHHILENYTSLADWTIFAQDNPFEHVDNWMDIVSGDQTAWDRHATLKQKGTYFFSNLGVLQSDQIGGPHHIGLPMLEVWNATFTQECPLSISFVPSCHCIIHRDNILARPVTFYQNIMQILEDSYYSPWVFERYLSYIFDSNFK
jgi:hypothetical protein